MRVWRFVSGSFESEVVADTELEALVVGATLLHDDALRSGRTTSLVTRVYARVEYVRDDGPPTINRVLFEQGVEL